MPKVIKQTNKKVKPVESKKAVVKAVKPSMRKTLKGKVVSDKMQKTVVVAIERKVAHPLYGKLLKVTKKFKADTNGMEIKTGDVVVIEQSRPLSRDKSFKVIRKEEAK